MSDKIMKQEIQFIVCDLDGTLLNDEKKITTYSQDVLTSCQAQGKKICFASGRYAAMMSVYDEQIGGCDYLISSNGAQVNKGSEVIYAECIENPQVNQLRKFASEHGYDLAIYCTKSIYFTKGATQIEKRYLNYQKLCEKSGYPTKLNYFELEDNTEIEDSVIKIVVYEDDKEKYEKFFAYAKKLNGISTESTGYGLIGLFSLDVSKKTAIEVILKELELSSDNVCVFGDYDNDLSMFECAKYKVAVENAIEVVKEKASFIAESNNEDGVAKFLQKIIEG